MQLKQIVVDTDAIRPFALDEPGDIGENLRERHPVRRRRLNRSDTAECYSRQSSDLSSGMSRQSSTPQTCPVEFTPDYASPQTCPVECYVSPQT